MITSGRRAVSGERLPGEPIHHLRLHWTLPILTRPHPFAQFQGVRSSVSVLSSVRRHLSSHCTFVPQAQQTTERSHALVHWVSPLGQAASRHHILSSGVPLEDGDKRRVSPPLAHPPIFCSLLWTRGPRGNPPYGCGGARNFHDD